MRQQHAVLSAMAVVGLITFVGFPIYAQQATTSVPSARLVEGFKTADVGTARLRYMCKGTGKPTVLIEQGAGISVETVFSWDRPMGWAKIVPQISKTHRICVYDRAGLGHSSKLERARSSLDVAHELRALLDKASIDPPYVFAGQSLGGINARAFAYAYRDSVVGMVLIDSSTPDQLNRFEKVLPPRSANESAIQQGFRDGPDRDMQGGEWYDFKANTTLANSLGSLGDMPLFVLTRSPNWKGPSLLPKEWDQLIEPEWQAMQLELTKLSTNSNHIVAKRAGHNIQAEEPDLVIDAIKDVLKRAKAK